MKTKELIIDRSKWRTGDDGKNKTGIGDTELINREGFMCCLGFEMRRCGIRKKDILEVGDPESISDFIWDNNRGRISHLVSDSGFNTTFTRVAIKINDAENRDPKIRERMIIGHFKKIGVKVKFINKYTKE